MRFRKQLRSWLEHPRLGVHLAVVAVLLGAPSLWLGWQRDDYVHRAALLGVEEFPELSRPWWRLFAFLDGDPSTNRHAIETGFLPWWSSPNLRLSFFRPVTGLTHWLDYRLWPNTPLLMHMQSLMWYALAVMAVARLYRALSGSALAAGWAALLFTIDDAHATPVVWIANRNMVVGVLFAALALLAHVRWRENRWRVGVWISPLALMLALLATEAAIATCAYIFAYAIFLERGSLLRRLRTVAPAAAAAGVWLASYRWYGYGATASGLYIDPVRDPLRYLGAFVERAPRLLWGQWAWPPSDVWQALSEHGGRLISMVSVAVFVILAAVLLRLLRLSRVARFWTAGMLLSVLPVCAVNAGDRLLMFVGIGAMGLLGQFFCEMGRFTSGTTVGSWRGPLLRVTCITLVTVHLVLAPLGLLAAAPAMKSFGAMLDRSVRSLPFDDDVIAQHVLIVQSPTAFLSAFGSIRNALEGRPVPMGTYVLGSSIYPLEVERPDERTLVLRPEWGFLAPSGGEHAGLSEGQPLFEPLYMLTQFDHLYRDIGEKFTEGERIGLSGLTAEVTALTEEGRPAEVVFTFDRPLEDPSYRWLQWKSGVYVPFELPAVGELLRLRLEHSWGAGW